MDKKVFNKYIVLKPDYFEKLLSERVSSDHLVKEEKEILKVLSDKKISPSQRMNIFRKIYPRMIRSREMVLLKKQPTATTTTTSKPTTHEMGTRTISIPKKTIGPETINMDEDDDWIDVSTREPTKNRDVVFEYNPEKVFTADYET